MNASEAIQKYPAELATGAVAGALIGYGAAKFFRANGRVTAAVTILCSVSLAFMNMQRVRSKELRFADKQVKPQPVERNK